MLLAIDAGNTQTVIGLYDGDQLLDTWRIATNAERTSDEHVLLLIQFLSQRGSALGDLTGLVVSCTVPRLTAVLREMASRYLDLAAVVLEPGIRSGMPILYDNPRQVGPDRIANAVGAFDLYGGPTVVVDFGTATTIDATSPAGEYLGGAILPGIEISLDALFDRAAALSWVELVPPKRVIGKSTPESIQSGVLFGFAAAVDGLCRRFEAELGTCMIVSTGGLGGLMAPLSECIQRHDPWLTLHGLRLIYELNR
ncbi:MAG: type pantothenate kinase [Actinomycetota bacterium]|jgi:type III pantothenate kinase|nr:type pantothenate kinase [Actinomycetota bacterium]